MDRVRAKLSEVVQKQSAAIEKTHAEGKIPADYSLGFANACIFVDHMLNLRPDGPKFFDRTTSIGSLPVPVALREKSQMETEYNGIAGQARLKEQIFLQEQIITQARGVASSLDKMDEEGEDPKESTIKEFSVGLASMKKAIETLDDTLTKHEELLHEQKKRLDQIAKEQEAATSQQAGDGDTSAVVETNETAGSPTVQRSGESEESSDTDSKSQHAPAPENGLSHG